MKTWQNVCTNLNWKKKSHWSNELLLLSIFNKIWYCRSGVYVQEIWGNQDLHMVWRLNFLKRQPFCLSHTWKEHFNPSKEKQNWLRNTSLGKLFHRRRNGAWEKQLTGILCHTRCLVCMMEINFYKQSLNWAKQVSMLIAVSWINFLFPQVVFYPGYKKAQGTIKAVSKQSGATRTFV